MDRHKKWAAAILIGFISGVITIYLIPNQFEILLWIILIVLIGLLGNRYYPDRPFVKTFGLALLTGIAITLTHITFLGDYLLSHKNEIEALNKIRLLNSDRLTLLIIAPIYWAVLGLSSGLIAKVSRRIVQKTKNG